MQASCTLYDEGTAPTLGAEEVAAWLGQRVPGLAVGVAGEYVSTWADEPARQALARRLAEAKVTDPGRPWQAREPLPFEVEYEGRRLAARNRGAFGIMYEGLLMQRALAGLLPGGEKSRRQVQVVLTNRLLGTWEADDRRYHLRTVVLGQPALVSTSGLVEAPARPREFYLAKRVLGNVSSDSAAYLRLKEVFAGRCLDHDDPRLGVVARGYALAAVIYQLTGEGFCADPGCMLYNAHWQEEMLAAQLGGRLCPRHEETLRSLRS